MDQAHGHDHQGHHHEHSHAPTNFGRAFAVATLLNVALVVVQIVYGVVAHSMALLADAGHNAGDALGLVLAWGAHVISKWRPTRRYTYGFRSASILASLLNGVILLIATGAIAWEAVQRFFEPGEVAGTTVMIVAVIGIVINGFAACFLMKGQHDLNVRGAFLHLVADAGVSVGVVVAGGVILLTGWHWIDPAVSLGISAVIVWSTWGLLRDSVNITLQAVPPEITPAEVQGYLEGLPGVAQIHDLHIWRMSTTETALTCHLVMPEGHPGDAFIARACHELHDKFGIEHPTLQIELSDAAVCAFEPEHVV